MRAESINLAEKLALFTDTWRPKVIAQLNDYQLKLVKLEGEFVWHAHDATDELFICLDGEFEMHLRERTVTVRAGELCVVPRGVEHKPVAANLCKVLIIEPKGVVNTGALDNELTAPDDDWI